MNTQIFVYLGSYLRVKIILSCANGINMTLIQPKFRLILDFSNKPKMLIGLKNPLWAVTCSTLRRDQKQKIIKEI
ncbi:hypothetical protein BpHYR1_041936 [Brachionus plicatilis]|uniref:Uncharacterized protein n=1 Tax=Brachionus plicatilis TaxID=10195 RepID=A0A3M7QPK1_BRAPC|nr:hypothetical protein BpHYR1_041936 [Brachionus plicatilis]